MAEFQCLALGSDYTVTSSIAYVSGGAVYATVLCSYNGSAYQWVTH